MAKRIYMTAKDVLYNTAHNRAVQDWQGERDTNGIPIVTGGNKLYGEWEAHWVACVEALKTEAIAEGLEKTVEALDEMIAHAKHFQSPINRA